MLGLYGQKSLYWVHVRPEIRKMSRFYPYGSCIYMFAGMLFLVAGMKGEYLNKNDFQNILSEK